MAWPPIIPPNTRTDLDAQDDNHPLDHNQIANALTDLVDIHVPEAVTVNLQSAWSGASACRRIGWLTMLQLNITRASVTAAGPITLGNVAAADAPSITDAYGVVHAHQGAGSNPAVANVLKIDTAGQITLQYQVTNMTLVRGQILWWSPPS